jgi:adenylyl cyclase-associated protein
MYVCKESLATTSFVTCTSTEMNVSFPDENGEQKELPIPEQFVHKLVDGAVQSSVSDLYH